MLSPSLSEDEADSAFTLHHELVSTLNQRGLKIAHLNVRRLRKNIDYLRLVLSRCKDLNILALSETWLNEDILNEEVAIPGCNIYRLDRGTGQRGRGVAVFISEQFSVIRRYDLETLLAEDLTLELFLSKSKGILLGAYYRPLNELSEFFDVLGDTLEQVFHENKEIIICGDFN